MFSRRKDGKAEIRRERTRERMIPVRSQVVVVSRMRVKEQLRMSVCDECRIAVLSPLKLELVREIVIAASGVILLENGDRKQ